MYVFISSSNFNLISFKIGLLNYIFLKRFFIFLLLKLLFFSSAAHTHARPGALVGGVLFALSCWLLWWNEGHYVRAANALKQVVGEALPLKSLGDAKTVPQVGFVCPRGASPVCVDTHTHMYMHAYMSRICMRE